MPDVFLLHHSADRPAVEALARRLRLEGIEAWPEQESQVPGNFKALERCGSCAVFIGLGGMGPWLDGNIRAAIELRARTGHFTVVPVLLPGSSRGLESLLPTFLTQATWVEFQGGLDDDAQFHRLVCAIQGTEPGPHPAGPPSGNGFPYRGLHVMDGDAHMAHSAYRFPSGTR